MPRPHRHIREALKVLPTVLAPSIPYAYLTVRDITHIVRDTVAPFDTICGSRSQVLVPRAALTRTRPDGKWCPACCQLLAQFLTMQEETDERTT